MKFIFYLFLCLLSAQRGESQSCSLDYQGAIRKCMLPFLSPSPNNIFLEGVFMDAVNTDMLDVACRQRGDVDNCIKNAGTCNNIWEYPEWVGLNDSLNYICNEGRPAFEKYQDCTTKFKPAYEAAFKLCLLGLPVVKNSSDPLESCRHTLGEYSCYANSSKLVCDSEKFMLNYCLKLHQPMKARQACKFDNVNWNIKELNMRCNVTKAAECMTSFTQGQFRAFSDGAFMTTPIDASFFSEACKANNFNKVCMSYVGRCKYFELADFWGIIESMDFLCNNKIAFDKYQKCTSNSDSGLRYFQSKLFNCQAQIKPVVNNMVSGQHCRRKNNDYNCYVQAAKDTCDSESFIIDYYKKLMQPTQSLKDCLLDNTRLNESSYSQCDSSKLMTCISKLKEIDNMILDLKPVTLNPTQFKDYCIMAYDTHYCVQDQAMCTDMDRVSKLNWLGIRKTWNYICLENKSDMQKFEKCLINDRREIIKEKFAECSIQDVNPSDDAMAKCRYKNEVEKCNVKIVEDLCRLGKLERDLFFYHNEDALRANYSCELELRSSGGTTLSYVSAIAVLKTMIAAAVIVLFNS